MIIPSITTFTFEIRLEDSKLNFPIFVGCLPMHPSTKVKKKKNIKCQGECFNGKTSYPDNLSIVLEVHLWTSHKTEISPD